MTIATCLLSFTRTIYLNFKLCKDAKVYKKTQLWILHKSDAHLSLKHHCQFTTMTADIYGRTILSEHAETVVTTVRWKSKPNSPLPVSMKRSHPLKQSREHGKAATPQRPHCVSVTLAVVDPLTRLHLHCHIWMFFTDRLQDIAVNQPESGYRHRTWLINIHSGLTTRWHSINN